MNMAVRIGSVCLLVLLFGGGAGAGSFSLKMREDKQTLLFTPKSAGKVLLSGKWEGSAKSLDVALYQPNQFFARWRGSISKNPFELSWDFSDKDIEESNGRVWKIVLRAKGGEAEGDADVTGDAVEKVEGDEGKGAGKDKPPDKSKPDKGGDVGPAKKDEEPALPLDDFGMQVRRTFVETPFYKPWVDKITAGKKSVKLQVRPLGLTVTPAVRKIRTRYGGLSLTIRNITLTPAQNVNLQESVSGSVETSIELLMRVEIPGWYLIAMQVEPFAAYPGEPARLTSMQAEIRSLSQGSVEPATSWPFSAESSLMLVPVLFSQPGEYVFSGRPIAREPAEILFVLRGIELYRLSA